MSAAESFDGFWGFFDRTLSTGDGQIYVGATVLAFCLGYLLRALISQRRRSRARYLQPPRVTTYTAWVDPSASMHGVHESETSTKSS